MVENAYYKKKLKEVFRIRPIFISHPVTVCPKYYQKKLFLYFIIFFCCKGRRRHDLHVSLKLVILLKKIVEKNMLYV